MAQRPGRRASGRRGRAAGAIAFVVGAALVSTACGSSSKSSEATSVAAAEARVSSAQKDVDNAQKSVTTANQQFCSAGKDYVSALDRYGRIFNDAKATVGDVKTAGADLTAPAKTVESAIDDVSAARTELARVQQDLADANVALAAAKATASSISTSSTAAPATTTSTTVLPALTVDRVKRAESNFTKSTATITDQTPVAKAGVVFNSAAFALEATWLQLLSQAGCLSDEQQVQAVAQVRDYTTALQTQLQLAGLYKGKVDGVYGPETVDAVEQLQTESKLPVTGLVDRATAVALDNKVAAVGANAAGQSLTQTAGVQSVLKVAGYWTGAVDGKWTPELTDALKKFQTQLGVPATGVVDPATLSAIETTVTESKASSGTSSTAAVTTTTAP
jgi:peptidoglycan hydrolase-like protein with peptidoglycan-binding domain